MAIKTLTATGQMRHVGTTPCTIYHATLESGEVVELFVAGFGARLGGPGLEGPRGGPHGCCLAQLAAVHRVVQQSLLPALLPRRMLMAFQLNCGCVGATVAGPIPEDDASWLRQFADVGSRGGRARIDVLVDRGELSFRPVLEFHRPGAN